MSSLATLGRWLTWGLSHKRSTNRHAEAGWGESGFMEVAGQGSNLIRNIKHKGRVIWFKGEAISRNPRDSCFKDQIFLDRCVPSWRQWGR